MVKNATNGAVNMHLVRKYEFWKLLLMHMIAEF